MRFSEEDIAVSRNRLFSYANVSVVLIVLSWTLACQTSTTPASPSSLRWYEKEARLFVDGGQFWVRKGLEGSFYASVGDMSPDVREARLEEVLLARGYRRLDEAGIFGYIRRWMPLETDGQTVIVEYEKRSENQEGVEFVIIARRVDGVSVVWYFAQ